MEIEFQDNFDMKKMTSFKIGGIVKKAWFPSSNEEFIYLLKNLKSPIVLGNCSNVLISSLGISSDVIFTNKIDKIKINGTKVEADCGVKGIVLAKKTAKVGLSGFEFMIGFPGSVGGNIYMNASANSQSISDKLVSVCIFDLNKKEKIMLKKDKLKFSYRSSILQSAPYIVLSADFELMESTELEVNLTMENDLIFRRVHQPSLALPNCGSVFRNPEGISAGKLLEEIGAKQLSVCGAKVWENHANFIVNFNHATSMDVLSLMFLMYNKVKSKYGIELTPEVRFLGEKTEKEDELCKILFKK